MRARLAGARCSRRLRRLARREQTQRHRDAGAQRRQERMGGGDFVWNALQVRQLQRYSNGSRAVMASNARDLSGCGQFRRASSISRREALRIGGLVGLGLTLPELLAAQDFTSQSSKLK